MRNFVGNFVENDVEKTRWNTVGACEKTDTMCCSVSFLSAQCDTHLTVFGYQVAQEI